MRTLSLTAILAAAIALPALAQTTPSQTSPAPMPMPMPSQSQTAPVTPPATAASLMLTEQEAKTWIGKPVYSNDDKKIGEVVAFARGTDNMVTEMHAGIGGFLGMGETIVRVMPAQIKLQSDRVVLNVTSTQAKDLPKVIK